MLGNIVGPRRSARDGAAGARRGVLDGEGGPPPYLTGITLPGRLSPVDGGPDEDVKVWIHPAQLLELWFRINL